MDNVNNADLSADPFSPFAPEDMARAGENPAPETAPEVWEPQMPAPSEPPEAGQIWHPKYGSAAACWVYRDEAGAVLFAVARFNLINGQKEMIPYTYGRREWTIASGMNAGKRKVVTGWHFKRPKPPIPLFGLDRLAAMPDAPVLVCEGEKTAIAASVIFPAMVCMTSQGGSHAANKSDWSVLAGRTVIVWPDNDGAGVTYGDAVARIAEEVGATTVKSVEVPSDWPEGWDLADQHPDGIPEDVALEHFVFLLGGAKPAKPLKLPPGFFFNDTGLWHQSAPKKEGEPPPPPAFIAAVFDVIGEANDEAGHGWGLVLGWRDRDGRSHQWSVPKRLVHADGNAIASELEDAGLNCSSDGRSHQLLKYFVGAVRPRQRLRCVSRTGWLNVRGQPAFILPGGEAFGPGARSVILQSETAGADTAYQPQGTLRDWQEQVAAMAVGNDRLGLYLAAAFAAPLLDITGEPSGGFHADGRAQSGKTTLARVAASVWGRADSSAQLRTWRATANGLEGTAALTSDTLLILDEIGQADAREVASVAYMLANEAGKSRASRDGSARRSKTWRTLFLSTGELSLAAKLAESGQRPMAGQEVRLIGLPADAGAGMGVFQNLHDHPGARVLADTLRDATRRHYGTAARAFLRHLSKDRGEDAEGLARFLADGRDAFLETYLPAGADGQVSSVARRFALVAGAGELARGYGVLPWPEGEAIRAAGACFQAWLNQRGGSGAAEDRQAVEQVRAFIEAHGTSRFELIGGEIAAHLELRTINRAGFRRKADSDARWEYLILPEAWRTEVCKGLDAGRVATTLAERGHLFRGTEGNRPRYGVKIRVPGHGLIRVYQIVDTILDRDGDDHGA